MGNLSTPISVQKLQRALHAKAKSESDYRFYALYDKMYREDILAHAYATFIRWRYGRYMTSPLYMMKRSRPDKSGEAGEPTPSMSRTSAKLKPSSLVTSQILLP